MTNSINVFLEDNLVGELRVDKYGTLSFKYSNEYIKKGKIALSLSMPVISEEYYGNEAHAYFAGLLPEESEKNAIARVIGTSPANNFALLKELGKECIGAVRIIDSLPTVKPNFKKLSDAGLLQLIQKQSKLQSFLYKNENVRLSIAGAQSKTSLFLEGGKYFVPKSGAPGNVILKPNSATYESLPQNEFATMLLAKQIGIDTPDVRFMEFDGVSAYIVDRYDRKWENKGIARIHQEDFCQALGINPDSKYEKDGGPGFIECVELMNDKFLIPALSLEKFLRLFQFNVLVGNRDAHGKNYSVVYDTLGPRLADTYDLVCTAYYDELSDELAMSVNGKFDVDSIQKEDWIQMAKASNISSTKFLAQLYALAKQILNALDDVLDRSKFDRSVEFKQRYAQAIRRNIRRLFNLKDLEDPIEYSE